MKETESLKTESNFP